MAAKIGEIKALLTANNEDLLKKLKQADTATAAASDGMSKSLGKASKSFKAMQAAAGAALAALSIKKLVNYADSWQSMASTIEQSAGSQQAAAGVLAHFSAEAINTGSKIEELTRFYNRNSLALSNLGTTTEDQAKLTRALNSALVASGASEQKRRQTLDNISRGLTRGKLAQSELNQVIRDGSVITQTLADELGVTVKELQKMADSGEITAKVLSDSLIKNVDELTKKASAMPTSVSDGLSALGSSVAQLVGAADTALGASSALGGALQDLGRHLTPFDNDGNLKEWAKNLDLVKDTAVLAGVVFAGRLTPAIIASGRQFLVAQAAAMRYQTSLGALTVAANTAKTAMGFLGGPAGAATAAALAISYFATKNKEAAPTTQDLKTKVQDLTAALDTLSRNQADAKLVEIEKDIAASSNTLRAAQARLESYQVQLRGIGEASPRFAKLTESIRAQKGAVDDAQEAYNELIKLQEALKKVVDGANDAIEENIELVSDNASEVEKQLQALQHSADTWGFSATQIALHNIKLAEATPEQYKLAEAIAATIDAKEADKKATEDAKKLEEERARVREQALDFYETENQRIKASLDERLAFLGQALADEHIKEKEFLAAKQAAINEYNDTLRANALDFSLTEEERLAEEWAERLEALTEALQAEAITREEFNAGSLAAHQQYEESMTAISQAEQQARLSGIQNALAAGATLMNSESKKLFNIGKAAALANASIDMYSGVMKAWALGPIIGPPLAALVGAAGIANIGKIASTKYGGGAPAPAEQPQQSGTGFSDTIQQNVYLHGIERDSLYDGGQILDALNGQLESGGRLVIT